MNISKTTRDVLASAGLALATAGALPATESLPGNPKPARTVPTPGRYWEDELQLRPPTADRALAANGDPTASPPITDTDQQRLDGLHPEQLPSGRAKGPSIIITKGKDGVPVIRLEEDPANTPTIDKRFASPHALKLILPPPNFFDRTLRTWRRIFEGVLLPGVFVAGMIFQGARSRRG